MNIYISMPQFIYDELRSRGLRATNKNVIITPNLKRREKEFGLVSPKRQPSRIDEIREQVEQIKQKYYEQRNSN